MNTKTVLIRELRANGYMPLVKIEAPSMFNPRAGENIEARINSSQLSSFKIEAVTHILEGDYTLCLAVKWSHDIEVGK